MTAFIVMTSHPAAARPLRSGDMITDQGWDTSARPSVPSDAARSPDMFPPVPNFAYNPDADMLSRLHPRYDYGREDMLLTFPNTEPAYPLFNYPPSDRP